MIKLFVHSLIFLLLQPYVFAEIDLLDVFSGRYRFTDQMTGEKVIFDIVERGEVFLDDSQDAYWNSTSIVNALGNEIGPEALPVMNIILAGGSDEQTGNLHIRLYLGGMLEVRLLDVVYAENDGYIFLQNIKLYKLRRKGHWEKLKPVDG